MEGTCLVGGGLCSGLHLLPSDSVSDCFRLGCAGLCCLLASGHGFLGLWKPPGGRTQPFPSGISPPNTHRDLGAALETQTAWLLAGAAGWALSILGRQQMAHHQRGDRCPLEPQ